MIVPPVVPDFMQGGSHWDTHWLSVLHASPWLHGEQAAAGAPAIRDAEGVTAAGAPWPLAPRHAARNPTARAAANATVDLGMSAFLLVRVLCTIAAARRGGQADWIERTVRSDRPIGCVLDQRS